MRHDRSFIHGDLYKGKADVCRKKSFDGLTMPPIWTMGDDVGCPTD
ncbi:MAG: hypothetical protein NNA20_07950 [Nitrospira sp.]|nr:hypothetical protein [Nitrospira sp.]MCP9442512.1 hypothetical protein [Nitrospira sp.]